MMKAAWAQVMEGLFVEYLAPGVSNHCPALLTSNKHIHADKPKSFRFFNYWTKHQEYEEVVKASWNDDVHGTPMRSLFSRLKHVLKAFNKS
ncbi:hypothetical protein V6N13_142391 [Hibiscus sabdariffa]